MFSPVITAAITLANSSLSVMGTLLLIAMLILRVLFEGIDDTRAQRLVESVTVVIVPLIFMFVIIAVFKIHAVLA